MAVPGGDAAAMVDFDQVAVAARIPARAEHGALGGGVDGRSIAARKVDAGMHGRTGTERIAADAEAAGKGHACLHRLVRRNGDHAVLQLVELLPAIEQSFETRISGALERTADA